MKKLLLIIACLILFFVSSCGNSTISESDNNNLDLTKLYEENYHIIEKYFYYNKVCNNKCYIVDQNHELYTGVVKALDEMTNEDYDYESFCLLSFNSSIQQFLNCLMIEMYNEEDAIRLINDRKYPYSSMSFRKNNIVFIDDFYSYIILGDYIKDNNFIYTKDESMLLNINFPEHSLTNVKGEKICASAFVGNITLNKIELSNNIRTIGRTAFLYNINLKTVVLKEGIEVIQSEAFKNCFSLVYTILPKGIQHIGAQAFTEGIVYTFEKEKPIGWSNDWIVGNAKVFWADEWYFLEDGTPVSKKSS